MDCVDFIERNKSRLFSRDYSDEIVSLEDDLLKEEEKRKDIIEKKVKSKPSIRYKWQD